MKVTRLIIIAFIVLILTVLTYITVIINININETESFLNKPEPPGKKIEIDRKKVYYTVRGKGVPTVIIEPGLGSASPEWWDIQNSLAKYTTVLTYDRAGYGWSDPGVGPRTAKLVASELQALVQTLQLKGPYIFIGHGIGALYVQYFIRMHPENISGAIFIDPISINYDRLKKELHPVVYNNLFDKSATLKIAKFFAELGLVRQLKIIPYPRTPGSTKKYIVQQYSMAKAYDAMLDEYLKGLKTSLRELAHLPEFPDIPLVIIHHSSRLFIDELLTFRLSYYEAHHIENIFRSFNSEISSLSRNGKIVYSSKGVYNIHFEDPEAIVSSAVSLLKK